MKKIFTLFFAITVSLVVAQPVIKGVYLPVPGTKIKQVYEIGNPGMGKPTFGANQTWNYSGAFINNIDTFELATYSPTDPNCICSQYVSHFPSATHVSFLRAPFALDDSTFTFFKIDTTGVWAVGAYPINSLVKNPLVNLDTAFTAVDEELFTPARPHFGGFLIDSSHYLDPLANGVIERIGIKTLEGLGYGTLITPVDTFNDVLLAKEVNDRWDSLGTLYSGHSSFTRYIFLRNNTFGSSILLMQQMMDTTSASPTNFAWYTLPVDVGSISGTVRDSSGALVSACPNCKAYLYRENSNWAINDILDKSDIDVNGNYLFDSIPYGIYRVSIRPDTIIYPHSLTTYYGDTTDWIAADTINTLACQCNTTGRDVTLKYRPGHSNTVNLSGSVTLEMPYWKKGGPRIIPMPVPFGQTIPGIDVVIRKTPGGSAAMQTQTDNSGNYNIGALDNGTYTMFVDVPGLHMAASYNFTVTGTTTAAGLDFVLGRKYPTWADSIYPPSVIFSSVSNILPKSNSYLVYPNPATNHITIDANFIKSTGVLVEVFNLLGEKVMESALPAVIGNNKLNIDISKLPAAVYIVRLNQDGEILQNIQLIKE